MQTLEPTGLTRVLPWGGGTAPAALLSICIDFHYAGILPGVRRGAGGVIILRPQALGRGQGEGGRQARGAEAAVVGEGGVRLEAHTAHAVVVQATLAAQAPLHPAININR